ncbi:MAG: hypothetical protein JXR22_09605 [Prolixibacteraceae bacterium]|nr:hypothetical protein [Prolixibacteraceae bacterium]
MKGLVMGENQRAGTQQQSGAGCKALLDCLISDGKLFFIEAGSFKLMKYPPF